MAPDTLKATSRVTSISVPAALKKILILIGWFGLYKVVWLCAVLGGGLYGHPILSGLPMVIWCILWIRFHKHPKPTLYLAQIACLYGLIWDSALVLSGVMHFPSDAQALLPSPPWMIVLWLGFGCIIHSSFSRLYGRYLLALAIGSVGGVMAYLGGVGMNALNMTVSKHVFVFSVGLEWGIAFPFLLWVSQKLYRT
jgi:hypothetical protein